MQRRDFLSILAGAAAARAQPGRSGPNVILIVADDLGYGDLSCYGQKILKTPNIDRLAAEGARFTDFYAGSTVCAPSRCVLMTGRHTGHATVRGNRTPEVPLRDDEVTAGEVVKAAGYRTAIFGKWGVGGPHTTGRPNVQGFDEFFGYLSQGHAHVYYPHHLWDNDVKHLIRENFAVKAVYSHHLFVERALEFMERNRAQPFFLYLPVTVPHANNELGRATGDGMEVPDWGSFKDKDWPNPEKGQAAMIELLDRDVGRILAKLDELGIAGNTLVLFTSDNGPHSEGGHSADFFDSNGPLRGIKRDLYEGGIRVPMLARWPGSIPADHVSSQPWAFWDILPTLAELAGVSPPEGIDGISMAPALLGRKQEQQHEYLYWEFHERGFHQAVRMGRWKAVRLKPGTKPELYDLETDLGESRNVAAEHPEIVQRIEGILERARTDSADFPVRG